MRLTLERLKELFDYCYVTGNLICRTRQKYSRHRVGDIVGGDDGKGYLKIEISGRRYTTHRLVWFYVYGEWPVLDIDHINHNRSDNRISNLREVPHSQNQKNKKLNSNSTSGYSGVGWYKPTNRWRAKISVNSKTIHLGYFLDINEAIQSRKDAEIKYGFHKNHGAVV